MRPVAASAPHASLRSSLRPSSIFPPLLDRRRPSADVQISSARCFRIMKVSLIQMNSISDKAANIAAAEALIERAVSEESPDWVLLPEQFDWAGGFRTDKLANAE